MPRPFFVDTDTASDDAVALVMALRHDDVEVVGIGVVAGNVPLPQAVQNALYTVELCGSPAPVHVGEAKPLALALETAQHVHGLDGMGDIGLRLSGREASGVHAVDALLAASHQHPGTLTLVTLGPLTNVARALERDPFADGADRPLRGDGRRRRSRRQHQPGCRVQHVGRSARRRRGAAVRAGDRVRRMGHLTARHAVLDPTDAAAIRAIGTPLAEFCIDIQGVVNEFALHETKLAGFDLPDPIAMAYAIDPAVATETRRLHCEIETASTITRGMVVMDLLGLTGRAPNALVVMNADRESFLAMLRDAVR